MLTGLWIEGLARKPDGFITQQSLSGREKRQLLKGKARPRRKPYWRAVMQTCLIDHRHIEEPLPSESHEFLACLLVGNIAFNNQSMAFPASSKEVASLRDWIAVSSSGQFEQY